MRTRLPETGRDWHTLRQEMQERGRGDVDWRSGRTAVYVFNAGPEVERVQREAYTMYMAENALGPLAFPSLKQMEDEVVDMALDLLHAPDGATGAMTSGGTDSITMALKAARDHARSSRRLSGRPNVVLARTGHPAFEKAAHMMDVEVRRVPVRDDSYEADASAMGAAIDARTIMMVGSAPSFPHGIIDPIAELGAIAEKHDVWLHVDACVGGFLAPFARMNGADLAEFDFEVAAVRSISADLHKYGYAAKGASTVLLRSAELFAHIPFDHGDWAGARLVTPTLAGTRPGGAIAAAWAVMNFLGVEGYRHKQRVVCDTRARIGEALAQMGFEILGDPKLGLIAFRHPDYDPYALWGKLIECGWFTSITVEPPSLHLMISPLHAEVVDEYLDALRAGMAALDGGDGGRTPEARYS
jgi:glutamate/tyrosine decarboxylase-like PLP-dependent enzyme